VRARPLGGPAESSSSSPAAAEPIRFPAGSLTFNRTSSCSGAALPAEPGESAPFSLLSYADVAKRAAQIAQLTKRRVMPPEGTAGEFADERRLSDAEIARIVAVGE
jgi:hypothetical protein